MSTKFDRNNLGNSWRALGVVRQVIALVLVTLAALQIALLMINHLEFWITSVVIQTVIGLLLIKASTAARETHTRIASLRRNVAKMGRTVEEAFARNAHALQTMDAALARMQLPADRTLETLETLGEQQRLSDARVTRVETAVDALAQDMLRLQRTLDEVDRRANTIVARLEDQNAEREQTRTHIGALDQLTTVKIGEVASAVRSVDAQVRRAFDGGNSHSLERKIVAEISALALLHSPGNVRKLPAFASWAMAPLSVQYIQAIAERLGSDSTVVELGSGVSTAWLAFALARQPEGPRLVAIDHDPKYAQITRQYLDDAGVRGAAEVILAPLSPVTVDGVDREWYGTEWIPGVKNIGLLVVDGPPAGVVHESRYPALPLLADRLSDSATIVLDDADRPGEAEVVKAWMGVQGMSRVGYVGRSLVLHYNRPTDSDD